MMLPENGPAAEAILFFDGYCGLCDGFVSRVLADPNAGRFRFSPLQGTTFERVREGHPELIGIDSLVVLETRPEEERVHIRSDASLFILSRMAGPWRMAAPLIRIFPRPVRDLGYRGVAAIRYRIFGKRTSCRLPTPDERALFLP
jgi:predicted DCC family thiol-disulfide oxidoreductase YuxK